MSPGKGGIIVSGMRQQIRIDETAAAPAVQEPEVGSADWAESEYRALRALVDEIHDHLRHPRPSSDHDWMYDSETGLPR